MAFGSDHCAVELLAGLPLSVTRLSRSSVAALIQTLTGLASGLASHSEAEEENAEGSAIKAIEGVSASCHAAAERTNWRLKVCQSQGKYCHPCACE